MPDIRDTKYLPEGWRADLRKMQIIGEDNDENEVIINAHFEVCDCCHGKGTVVNPNIDRHGIGQDEWAEWDDEEREGYVEGRYDVPCPHCEGRTTILVPDEGARDIEKLHQAWEDQRSYDSEIDAERRMGA